ncbi:MAG: type II secretion system protein GspD [Granulosicoccus sp.]
MNVSENLIPARGRPAQIYRQLTHVPVANLASARAVLAALVVMFSISGCAVDLAKMPDTSFNPGSRVNTAPDQQVLPGLSPVEIKEKTAATKERLLEDPDSPSASLTDSTNTLLEAYGYSEKPRYRSIQDDSGALNNPRDSHVDVFSIEAVSAPIQALLFALSSDAGIQLKIHGELDDLVTLNSIDQTMEDTLLSLAQQGGFAWQMQANTLEVWAGDAFSYSYPINYLNIHRRTQSSVGLATRVGTINATDSAGGSIANSSQTRVENISEHHFWDSLASDIENLLQLKPDESDTEARFSLNREAGLLSVHAKPDVHRALQRYIKLLHGNTQRQVLIEATVVEVALSKSFDAGVDWQVLANGISGVSAAQVLTGAPVVSVDNVNRLAAPAGLVSLVQQGSNSDVQATLSLLEQFGDVRILSRPRIIALNNQSSVLKVVDNRVYFTVNVQRRQTEEKDEIVTETEIHTVPVGLVMNVTPQISEQGMVMLNVRPTLSRILGFVDDPNPELALANVRNGVPEIQVREMESMLQVRSGNVAIIGGLMQETHTDNDARLPGLGALPVIGRLFAKKNRKRRQTELLIVLRPTVLENSKASVYPRS